MRCVITLSLFGVLAANVGTHVQAQTVRIPVQLAHLVPDRCAKSPDDKALYIPTPDNRLQAIAIDSGKTLWTSADKLKPLAALTDTVCGLINEKRGVIRLAALHADTGKVVKLSDAYDLPVAEPGLVVEPRALRKEYSLGFHRVDSFKGKFDKSSLGTLFFDPATGRLELKDYQVAPAKLVSKSKTAKLEKAKVPPVDFQKYNGFVADDRFIQVFYGRDTRSAYVLSVHWDRMTGKHIETKEIWVNRRGNALGGISPVAGGRFVVHRDPGSGDSSLYSGETGKQVVAVPKGFLPTWWVIGNVAIGVEPAPKENAAAKLHGYDLTNGKRIWSHPCSGLVGQPK